MLLIVFVSCAGLCVGPVQQRDNIYSHIMKLLVQDLWYSLNKKEVDAAMAGHDVREALQSVLRKPAAAVRASSAVSGSPGVVARKPAASSRNDDITNTTSILQALTCPEPDDTDLVRDLEELMEDDIQPAEHAPVSPQVRGDVGSPAMPGRPHADVETQPHTAGQQVPANGANANIDGINATLPDTEYQDRPQPQPRQHATQTAAAQDPVDDHDQECAETAVVALNVVFSCWFVLAR